MCRTRQPFQQQHSLVRCISHLQYVLKQPILQQRVMCVVQPTSGVNCNWISTPIDGVVQLHAIASE